MTKKKIDVLLCASMATLLIFTAFPFFDFEIDYGLLRVIIFSASIFLFANLPSNKIDRTKSILIIVILLFNPLLKVTLHRETWIVIDVLSSAFFVWLAFNRIRDLS